ncbi:hypothetical protein L917_19421 [Phytophthora nicotianae]|uniref:N-acetyltransferase domain-containing protein n=2 Tax=Phytophthora nicotianae TaxID=4792 RepID=V9E425_PHYNI|nr:hypothetical protein F443_20239 [Phytophthora nicotianae P1569]ETL80051.1 hypothetical protein L917_19421 [Phytophthora nicotianae]ETM33295.1 hypothetical protein L914_19456 [Phytophthora nicotianae]
MTYSKPGGNFWVATPRLKPTEMVGIVGLESQDANAGKLRRMSVKENYRRRGVGHLLIQAWLPQDLAGRRNCDGEGACVLLV